MRSSTSVLIALAVLSAGATLHASQATSSRVPDLRAAKERAKSEARQTKGGPQHLLLMKRERITSLIDRLGRGEAVDPREIDRLLEETGPATR